MFKEFHNLGIGFWPHVINLSTKKKEMNSTKYRLASSCAMFNGYSVPSSCMIRRTGRHD